jgi:hypothetical protein
MSGLDRLIRPFQAVDVTYPRRIIKVDEAPPDNVVLKIGDTGGSVKTLGYSRSYSLSTYMQKRQKELEPEAPIVQVRHVKRIPGKAKSGAKVITVPGAWIDVERDDEVITQEGSGVDYQKTKTKLQWYLDDDGNEPNGKRKTHTLKVIPTDADPEDPYLWWEIDANDAITVVDFDQKITRRFDNSKDNTKRRARSKVRRVVHSDTPYDDDPAYENGGVIRDYQKTPDTKDPDQHLDVEIVGGYVFDDYRVDKHQTPPQFEHWQRTLAERDIDRLIEDTEEPADKSYADDEINPPYRLDPFQRIVNVQVGELDYQWVLAVKPDTQVGGGFNPWPQPMRADAADGKTWNAVSSGASGFGLTVITAGCIAFGFVTRNDGSKRQCFLRAAAPLENAPACLVYMGTLRNGELVWQAVFTAPSSVTALSFANDAFFISHLVPLGDGNFSAAVTVTRDGQTFTRVNPFVGLETTAPGNVAYDKKGKVYACIAMVFIDEGDAFSSSMAWATSSDGLTWSADYQADVYGQPGQNGSPTRTTVCFGNGIFVAAASYKNRFPRAVPPFPPGTPDYVLSSCAVATSTNGKKWSIIKLPDAVVRSSLTIGDRAGDTFAVAFIRDKKDDPSGVRDGYFMACGQESGGHELTNTAKLWRSADGLSWTLVKQQDSSVFHPVHYDALSAIAKKLPTDAAKIVII